MDEIVLVLTLRMDMDRSLQKDGNFHSPYLEEWTWTDHSKLSLNSCNSPSLSIPWGTDMDRSLQKEGNILFPYHQEWTWMDFF